MNDEIISFLQSPTVCVLVRLVFKTAVLDLNSRICTSGVSAITARAELSGPFTTRERERSIMSLIHSVHRLFVIDDCARQSFDFHIDDNDQKQWIRECTWANTNQSHNSDAQPNIWLILA